jgi:hypothetical protein
MLMDLFLQDINIKKENKFEKVFFLMKIKYDLAVIIFDFASNKNNWHTFDYYKNLKVLYLII